MAACWKKTLSAAVGTAPANVVKAASEYQLAVFTVDQTPAPPPQYLLAIDYFQIFIQ